MSVAALTLMCLVLTVQDGDSLQVRCENAAPRSVPLRVRLHAVDAPESGQPYGRRARQTLHRWVYRQPVELRCVDTDRYGRRVCQLWLPAHDGLPARDVGLALIHEGLGWWYRTYAHQQNPADRQRYEQAEASARRQGRGLWRAGETAATPPWRWRQAQPSAR